MNESREREREKKRGEESLYKEVNGQSRRIKVTVQSIAKPVSVLYSTSGRTIAVDESKWLIERPGILTPTTQSVWCICYVYH